MTLAHLDILPDIDGLDEVVSSIIVRGVLKNRNKKYYKDEYFKVENNIVNEEEEVIEYI